MFFRGSGKRQKGGRESPKLRAERKERKRNRGLREKQKAGIGAGELREEMGGRLSLFLLPLRGIKRGEARSEADQRIMSRPSCPLPDVLWLGRGIYKWQLSYC